MPSFKIGTNVKISLNGEKNKPDIKLNEEQKQDVKPDINLNKERKQEVKPNIKFDRESKHEMNKITYEEEKVALVLGITSVFTVWWLFK